MLKIVQKFQLIATADSGNFIVITFFRAHAFLSGQNLSRFSTKNQSQIQAIFTKLTTQIAHFSLMSMMHFELNTSLLFLTTS